MISKSLFLLVSSTPYIACEVVNFRQWDTECYECMSNEGMYCLDDADFTLGNCCNPYDSTYRADYCNGR